MPRARRIVTIDGERINKALARAGVASRRAVEDLIRAGRITVDGKPADLGQRVTAASNIRVDGKQILLEDTTASRRHVIMYHKPEGEICTARDPQGRRTVFDSIGEYEHGRLVSVGRLDLNTSGLLLLTTDGELANRLMHPRYEIRRVYSCRVLGTPTKNALERLRKGVEIDGHRARFLSIEPTVEGRTRSANRWYTVTLAEGRNREVRKLFEAVGLSVNRLIRTQYGSISLPDQLTPGNWQELTRKHCDELARTVSLNHS